MRRIVCFMLIGPLIGYFTFIGFATLSTASGSLPPMLSFVFLWLFLLPLAYLFGLPGATIVALLDYAMEQLRLGVLIRLPICAGAAYVASYACFLFLKGYPPKPDLIFGLFGVAAAIFACVMNGWREFATLFGDKKRDE